MKRLGMKIFSSFLILNLSAGPFAFAQESEVMAQLRRQVDDLTTTVSALQKQIQTMEGHITAAPGKEFTAQVVPPGEQVSSGLIRTMQDIHMGGYMDVEYNQNLTGNTSNNPSGTTTGATTPGGNPLRVFDNDQNTFGINAAVLEFEKTPNPEGGAGFRLDIAMGENAETVDQATIGTDADEFSIQQAFVDFVVPLKALEGNQIFDDTIDFKVGRYVTLAGAEVIRSPDNWNISRSFLFGFSIPFTHTGARATYKLFNDKLTTYWGLNNGWDNVIDNNQMKTLETGFSFSPFENVTHMSSLYWGPENARQGGHRRFILSNVLSWKVTDKLSLMANIDFGNERRVAGLQGFAFRNAQWHGYAGYARYQLTNKVAFAYRIEFFRDDDTFRTGASVAKDQDSLWEQTVTGEYEIYTNLLGRLEYRYDKSDDRRVFNGQSSQQTIGAQLIYKFA